MKPYWVYIVECSDDTYYCGITTDIERRMGEHNGTFKNGAKYTSMRRPVLCVFANEYNSRSLALKEEIRIKKLSRSEKNKLIHEKI